MYIAVYILANYKSCVDKYDEMNCNNTFVERRVTQIHNKLEIVEVHNDMIKSTIKANGKTAA